MYVCANNEFQFHKGTIKTKLWVKLLALISYFNSIKVQLRLTFDYKKAKEFKPISIP